jgi:hypothetical protein
MSNVIWFSKSFVNYKCRKNLIFINILNHLQIIHLELYFLDGAKIFLIKKHMELELTVNYIILIDEQSIQSTWSY